MLATSMTLPDAAVGTGWAFIGRSALLGAVADGELLLLGVLLRRGVDHRLQHLVVRLVPVGNHRPFGAVPLLDAAGTRAFVVVAGHLERLQHALESELLETGGADIEVLDTPAHLLAGERFV